MVVQSGGRSTGPEEGRPGQTDSGTDSRADISIIRAVATGTATWAQAMLFQARARGTGEAGIAFRTLVSDETKVLMDKGAVNEVMRLQDAWRKVAGFDEKQFMSLAVMFSAWLLSRALMAQQKDENKRGGKDGQDEGGGGGQPKPGGGRWDGPGGPNGPAGNQSNGTGPDPFRKEARRGAHSLSWTGQPGGIRAGSTRGNQPVARRPVQGKAVSPGPQPGVKQFGLLR